MPVVSLLSDFGLKDPYVAEMKAVIISICPEARIIDITHQIRKFDIKMGAYILAHAAPYFPKGTVHVAVVDPGVGTERKPIIIETKRSIYVGPDNGLLTIAAKKEGITHTYKITNPKYMLKKVSRTFHGRDIFSPAAAHLARGVPPSEFGPEIENPTIPEFMKPHIEKDKIISEIIHIDDFGNITTNISQKDLEKLGIKEKDEIKIKLKDKLLTLKICTAYNEVPTGTPLAIIGSGEHLEISINQRNAAKTYNVKPSDQVQLFLETQKQT